MQWNCNQIWACSSLAPWSSLLLVSSVGPWLWGFIPVFFHCRPVLGQWRHRSYHPIIQLPAVRRWSQGVSGWGFGQDGAFPLPVLDPTALHPLCPTRTLSAQSRGQVWCGPPASQVQGERCAQTRLGEKEPGVLSLSLWSRQHRDPRACGPPNIQHNMQEWTGHMKTSLCMHDIYNKTHHYTIDQGNTN